jgi:signal transduction histidine kinase
MAAVNGHRPTSRTLQVAAVATVIFTVLATGLCYLMVARSASSAAQPVVWLGLACVLFEMGLAAWCLRAVVALEQDHKRDYLLFAATAVHDVRQPLQAATLFIDSLLHASIGPQPLQAVHRLDESVQSVRYILDDFLDISSLDAGAVPVKKQPFNIIELLRTLEAEFAPQAISKNLRLRLYEPPTDVWVNSDLQCVQMVLRKLLIHSIAKTQHGGVLLGMRQRTGQVLVQIWDTHTPTQPILGTRSARGLAIAERVAKMIQSPLIFSSKIGRGAVYTLMLSRDSAHHDAPLVKDQIPCP